jgi:hypothetical protein
MAGIVFALAIGASQCWAEKPMAQALITKEPCASFEAAKAKAVSQVKDGEPVYLNLLFPKPVTDYLSVWETSPNSSYCNMKVFYLEIGEAGGSDAWNYCYLLPMQDELKGNFLCACMAPYKASPVWRAIWLKTVGEGAAGVWKNELRIYDKGDDGSLDRRLVALAPLTANVASGISKYAAQLADYKQRFAAGDIGFNQPPAKGELVDKAAIKAALAEAENAMDDKPEGCYFSESGWFIHKDSWDKLDYYHAMAVVFFRRDGTFWMREMDVMKWAGTNKVEIALKDKETELSSATYQKALSQSQAK